MQVFVRSLLSGRTFCLSLNGQEDITAAHLKSVVAEREGTLQDWFSLTRDGRYLDPEATLSPGEWLCCVASLPAGKGGFGSMLRAIGAQIEKTTNREACRDLSGRRLRDINHETRLRRWVARQAEREAKKKEPRKEPPRHQLNDPDYDKIRDQLPDRVQEAVSHGLSVSSKRPSTSNDKGAPPEKRHRRAPLMIGLEELPSSSEDEKESLKGEEESTESSDAPEATDSSPSPPPKEMRGCGSNTEQQDLQTSK